MEWIEIIISAVHLATGRLHLYVQAAIEIDHLMASSAMPILFPWQSIGGELYWDGGVMANSPLFIALEKKVEEIIVVLLSPVGHRQLPPPASLRDGLERVFEGTGTRPQPKISGVAPTHMLGFASLLNFSARQVKRLIHAGYHNARRQLAQKG